MLGKAEGIGPSCGSVRLVPSRQIIARIGWLLGALLVLSLLALAGLRRLEKDAVNEILDEEMREHGRLLDGVMELNGAPLRLLVEVYARRTVFTRPNENDNSAKASPILEAGVRLHGVDAAWVVEGDGKVRLRVVNEPARDIPAPIGAAELAKLGDRRAHYYLLHEAEIFEVRGRRLSSPRGDASQAGGWIFAANRLDSARLAPSRLPIEGRVSMVLPGAPATEVRSGIPIRIDRTLADVSGKPLRILRVEYVPDEIAVATRAGSLARLLISGFLLLSFAVLGFSLWYWAVRPAMLMKASLEAKDVKLLAPLFEGGGDLAKLAHFVRLSLENQESLKATLDERARMGRDLHDGVIQTIYSAGLGLARVRNHLESDPEKADALLLEVRSSLDHAVKELRSHIEQIELEPSGPERLQISLLKLKVLAHTDKNVRFDIHVEAAAEDQLGASQRIDILYFASEAFSNALRHGRASFIEFRLTRNADGSLLLAVSDNGAGFAPTESQNPFGQGMSNLRLRAARLGGELQIGSSADHGTRLSLIFQPK